MTKVENSLGAQWLHALNMVNTRVRMLAYQEAPHADIARILDGMDYVLDQLMQGQVVKARTYLLEMARHESALNDIADRVAQLPE